MIGVLALQGAFQKHLECLKKLSVPSLLVRSKEQLAICKGLIIPGGETTVHLKLISKEFWKELKEFGQTKPIFGTCCGLILLSKLIVDSPLPTLNLLDIEVSRNAYGSQINSFEETLSLNIQGVQKSIKAAFIRAPKIVKVGKGVNVLSYCGKEPVVVENHFHLAATFHPELFLDITLHEYFVSKCGLEKNVA